MSFPPTDYHALAKRVSLDNLAVDSRIILSIAPCRSGTTAMLRAFGALGIESYLQPLKNLLRWQVVGEERVWRPGGTGRTLFIKETLGPFTEAEVRFDPLALLLAAGLPPENLTLLVMGRTPLETWVSWRKWWPERTDIGLFIDTYLQNERIRQQALQSGVATTTLVYEAFRDHPAAAVMQRLCLHLGLDYDNSAVAGWRQLPTLGAEGSGVVIPQMPKAFTTRDIRQRVEEGSGFSYFSRAGEVSSLDDGDVARIEEAGLSGVYDSWRQACEQDLGLAIHPADAV